jgi:hypothetical protein
MIKLVSLKHLNIFDNPLPALSKTMKEWLKNIKKSGTTVNMKPPRASNGGMERITSISKVLLGSLGSLKPIKEPPKEKPIEMQDEFFVLDELKSLVYQAKEALKTYSTIHGVDSSRIRTIRGYIKRAIDLLDETDALFDLDNEEI